MSFKRSTFTRHVSVSHPRRGEAESGISDRSSAGSYWGLHLLQVSLKYCRCWNSPMNYMIHRRDPLGSLRARDLTVGGKWPKYRWILGTKLGMSRNSR